MTESENSKSDDQLEELLMLTEQMQEERLQQLEKELSELLQILPDTEELLMLSLIHI